jgi:hypothetical protein
MELSSSEAKSLKTIRQAQDERLFIPLILNVPVKIIAGCVDF